MMHQILYADTPDFQQQLNELMAFETAQDANIDATVAAICADIQQHKDAALVEYTNRFDRRHVHSVAELTIENHQLQAAFSRQPHNIQAALKTAATRIEHYHQHQKQQSWYYYDEYGSMLGQHVTALDRVGIYVPGGKAAYPSSVLMNAIPAHVAGVKEIIMAVPAPDGECNDIVLAAAYVAGVDQIFTIGGAQAIAALAYGTESVPQVDKITGPGNAYVAAAKRRVFGVVGIDMVAGPSEILVIADGSTDPRWVAMDLFSQAEHDEIAQAILITTDPTYWPKVEAAMQAFLPTMPRRQIIETSLKNRGAVIIANHPQQALEIANFIAPEHLELSVRDPDHWLPHLHHAGAIFMGAYTSESLGDYCVGANHVLPTSRTARFASALGVYDFQKRSSVIKVSADGADHLGRIAAVLADGEGLTAHAEAARLRLNNDKSHA